MASVRQYAGYFAKQQVSGDAARLVDNIRTTLLVRMKMVDTRPLECLFWGVADMRQLAGRDEATCDVRVGVPNRMLLFRLWLSRACLLGRVETERHR
jgi:hypothetical protein